MSRLAFSNGSAAALNDRAIVFYDDKGVRAGEQKLDKRGLSVGRFGDEWLVLGDKQKQLARVSAGSSASAFAIGKAAIGAFGVGRDDTVAVARGEAVELWSRDDERRWSSKGASPPSTSSSRAITSSRSARMARSTFSAATRARRLERCVWHRPTR